MSNLVADPPFEDSRRLTGCNLFFEDCGAVLESVLGAREGVSDAWRVRIARARAALGWPQGPIAVRPHAHGVSLVFAAPLDQLYAATEVNEWALCSALRDCGIEIGPWPDAPEVSSARNDAEALEILAAAAREEGMPALRVLAGEAAGRGINLLADDEQVTLGSGRGGRSWLINALPAPSDVDWDALCDIPIALVTGSNGKTTITRLLAAMAKVHGWRTAHTCTDGVFVDAEAIDLDDYSGPGGARLALRRTDIDAAVLETARGGMLRRGIAPQHADVAVVANVSEDHFGEYGIDNLDDLAEAKLTVARPLGTRGTLVVNGDDEVLLRHARAGRASLALFGLDADAPLLRDHRAQGGASAGVRDGQLVLELEGSTQDLGAIEAMPLTYGGAARYNIANIAAAVLAADVLGIGADTIRSVLASFGARPEDNPGRLEHHVLGDIETFLDFAHNPDGLRGLLEAATRDRRGRVGMILGQAGDRSDHDMRELAAVAAAARPDYVVLKDQPEHFRGREAGEVPAILRGVLLECGIEQARIVTEPDEWQAVLHLLAWAKSADKLVLQVLDKEYRLRISPLLDRLSHDGWRAGSPMPADAI
ncbi:MAG: Mur ligase [Gammaproteobacteria bacterium]|nr:Mur ligase [Gammaproteobacteria bacterium]